MKKNILSISIICIIVFIACVSPKQTKQGTAVKKSEVIISYAQMWRSACFGRCPEYKIEVYKEGLIRYTGMRFAKDSGIYEKNVGTEKAAELLGLFSTYRADTCKDNYENIIPDLPGLTYVLTINNKNKTIRNASFGPDFLPFIAKQWDAEIHVDKTWKRVSETKLAD